MAIGGYAVIDLKGANFGNTEFTLPGFHEEIEKRAGKKPILIRNFLVSEVEHVPVYTMPSVLGYGGGHTGFFLPYEFSGEGVTGISVRDDDIVARRFFKYGGN